MFGNTNIHIIFSRINFLKKIFIVTVLILSVKLFKYQKNIFKTSLEKDLLINLQVSYHILAHAGIKLHDNILNASESWNNSRQLACCQEAIQTIGISEEDIG